MKWFISGGIFYTLALILFAFGWDRLTSYSFDNYLLEDVNVFVGNDADNLIINSNILQGYFTLSAGFLIAGTLLIAAGSIIGTLKQKDEKVVEATLKEPVLQ